MDILVWYDYIVCVPTLSWKFDIAVLQREAAGVTRERTAGYFIRFYVVHKETMFSIVSV